MAVQILRRRLWPGVGLLLACLALFGLGRLVAHEAPALGLAPARAAELPQAELEDVELAGLEGGQITLAGRVVAILTNTVGGLTGWERTLIVADRLNRQIRAGLKPEEVVVRIVNRMPVVEAAGMTLVSVTGDDARVLQEQPQTLALRWARNLRAALGEDSEPKLLGAEPVVPTAASAEPYRDKIVPILSLLEGTRLGVARINGPSTPVGRTQAVTQFSIDFRNYLEIDIYVPISTATPGKKLDRIQGVGLTGLGDLKL
jgi:hypothetical protein